MIVKRSKNNKCTFSDICVGDVFFFDERYFLRVMPVDGFNAVNLETGTFSTFYLDIEVISCEGYFHVN